MSNSLLRKLISGVMPKGSIWTVKIDGFFDALLDALADSLNTVKLKLSELSDIRNAKKTTLLDELERDYGVSFNPNLTESERRTALDSRINAIDNSGSRQELEFALQRAGFPLFVYSNSPAVDPSRFQNEYEMVAGEDNSFAGEPDAIAGTFFAKLIINGPIIISKPLYALTAGDEFSFAGEDESFAEISDILESEYEYFLPTNSNSWPFIFIVGGNAVLSEDGSIISVAFVDIDKNREQELRDIILRYKPMFTWGIIQIRFI